MLAADRGREGQARRSAGRGRGARFLRERHSDPGRRRLIVDSLTFLGDSLYGHSSSATELLARMDDLGVDHAIVCPVRTRLYDLAASNEAVAEAVSESAGRLIGVARVDPLLGDEACAELERALETLGLCGLFLHPWEETFRIAHRCVSPVVEVAQRHGAPVIIASGYPWLSEALQVGALAHRFPGVTFIATNGLQLNISGLGQIDAELAIAENDNLLIQTTGVYREDFLEGIGRRFGAHRLLYASGYPLFDPRLETRRVQWATFSEPDRAAILGGNAAAVFGLAED